MSGMLSRVFSAELEGIGARPIEVEVDLHVGLHSFNIIGLADKALSEAKERVNSALKNSGAKPPNRENRKITVNLAPADVKKTGSHYDLAIAIGYLRATEQMKEFATDDTLFIGELALDGRLRAVGGALNIAQMARERGFKKLFVPAVNASEAAAIQGLRIIPVEDLRHAVDVLEGKREAAPVEPVTRIARAKHIVDLSEVKGQEHAKRALVIAAAGGHNLLMTGPPGVGKSLLAQAILGLLPELDIQEAIEVTKIYSVAGLTKEEGLITSRPFRCPHQSASAVAVIGGGSDPKPGEISLAHRGVLFLDEMPEFPKDVLESLRQPLEEGVVHVSRAKKTLAFPAKFTLIAAMNPCPCGYYGDEERECRCGAYDVIRYQKKISGPLLDRIDLQIKVNRVPLEQLRIKNPSASETERAKKKIDAARKLQKERFAKIGFGISANSEMSSKQVEDCVSFDGAGERFLKTLGSSRLSPRGFYRLIKTAQTIADLDEAPFVGSPHLAEAYSYRLKEEL